MFNELAVGHLAHADFVADATGHAATSDQHDVYDTRTGVLSYDADGSGTAHAAVAFATLAGHPALTASDFLVV